MRFAIATLGCKVNQYDSAIIESRMGALGISAVNSTNLPTSISSILARLQIGPTRKACGWRGGRDASIRGRA